MKQALRLSNSTRSPHSSCGARGGLQKPQAQVSQIDSSMQQTNPKAALEDWAAEERRAPQALGLLPGEHIVGHTGEDPVAMLPKHTVPGKEKGGTKIMPGPGEMAGARAPMRSSEEGLGKVREGFLEAEALGLAVQIGLGFQKP